METVAAATKGDERKKRKNTRRTWADRHLFSSRPGVTVPPLRRSARYSAALLSSPLLSSPAKFFVESKFDFRITLIFLEEEEEEEEEERGGWISGKIKGWIGLNRDEFGFRQASFRERMLAFEVKERKRGRYVRCV